MNFLFTSTGRRVELLKLAKKTLSDNSISGNIIAADASLDAPTSKFCDFFEIVPRISDDKYIQCLLDICKRRNVDILVPTIDTELLKISQNIEEFKKLGVLVNIPDASVVKIFRDKTLTQKFFEENGIPAPKEISPLADPAVLKFPLIIKPMDGSSSVGVFKINNAREFDFFKNYVRKPIIQECILGDEFTVDAFCGFDSKPVTIVPRLRIAVRAGEILKGKTVKDKAVINATAALLENVGAFGHITIQCIKNGDGIFFIEINPRFGGGAPMSIMAGANSILNLIKLKRGETLRYNEDWRENLTFSRFDDCVSV